MNVDAIVAALLSGPLPVGPLVAALPMYDWPEQRQQVDAQWARLRDALRAKGVDAPEHLARCNTDLPTFNGSSVDLPPDEFDLGALWRHPNLLIAQACWGPMEAGLADHVRVVGQEDYTGIEGGHGEFYGSAIVMRREVWTAGGASLTALLNGQRLAYNAPDSMSGYLALQRDLAAMGSGLEILADRIVSGGHRNSIRMVANGAADVAVVDCKTWALALKHEPVAQELVVVGWTQKRLGLPFITAKAR